MTSRQRKSLQKYLLLNTIIVLMIVTLSGCSAKPKNFTVNGLTITLTEEFSVGSAANYDVYISNDDVSFSAVEEDADTLEYAGYEIASLNDYSLEILELNKASKDSLIKRDNYYYFTNTSTKSGASFTYVHCMFKGNSSYWVCEFVCKTKDYKRLENKILGWADTIVIN